ncbi:MAG: cell wall metabolism sensor histidine kinase WalK [Oscillospiraceae bacterium]|nr:cell wall metabolism sensor histidine kinase WalK [Oscillospiraceae bacterium]
MLLIVSLMAVVGSFLIARIVQQFYMERFSQAMKKSFENVDFVDALRVDVGASNIAGLKDVLEAYSGILGVDLDQRNFFILDAMTGEHIAGSNDELGARLEMSPNIVTALSGESGYAVLFSGRFMDCAVPVTGGDNAYIIYIRDEKTELSEQMNDIFIIIVQALMIGLVIAVLLAFALSKTMTNPIENLTKSAQQVASGSFTEPLAVHSNDEIGVLTKTFNGMAVILRDTLNAIGNERDKLGTLFLHMNDGVAAFGKHGMILHMNPAAETMLCVEFKDTLTFDELFDDIITLAEVHGETITRTVERGDLLLNMSFTTFGGEVTEGGVMALIYDITEQARLDRMRREFVSSVSHELRTPLTNVKGYAETLTNPEDIDADTIAKFSSVIVNEADRMTRIVSDLFTLSRFDYGQMDWHMSNFSATDLLKGAFEAMRLEALHRGQKLSLDIPLGLPELYADKERLAQVFVNILSNAIKYTPDGGDIGVRAWVGGGYLTVSVKDTGIGIPKKDIERVFERFYRVDKARSRASGGTGLGLSIAREIIEYHNGIIEIDSKEGKGTTVTVKIKL